MNEYNIKQKLQWQKKNLEGYASTRPFYAKAQIHDNTNTEKRFLKLNPSIKS